MSQTTIFQYQAYQKNIDNHTLHSLLLMDKNDFEDRKNKIINKYNIPQQFNTILIRISNSEQNGIKHRIFYETFVEQSNMHNIMQTAIDLATEGDTEIFFTPKNIYQLFQIILNRDTNVVKIWTYNIFCLLLNYVLTEHTVIPQNKNKAFTFLLYLSPQHVDCLTAEENILSIHEARKIRRVLAQIIDPKNQWLGSQGNILTIAHNSENYTYSLVARKPRATLRQESPIRFLTFTRTINNIQTFVNT